VLSIADADATIWVAGIAALGAIASAGLTYANRRQQDTGNGHTIGQGVARIEDQMRDHENRLDRIEVHTIEQFADIKESLHESKQDRSRIAHELELHHVLYRHELKDLP